MSKHKCKSIDLRPEPGGLGWTAICHHLGLAACAEDWPEAKANLRVTIKSALRLFDSRKIAVPAEVLNGTMTREEWMDAHPEEGAKP